MLQDHGDKWIVVLQNQFHLESRGDSPEITEDIAVTERKTEDVWQEEGN